MIIALSVFLIAMSAVTNAGVGSISGTGDLSISIPGELKQISMNCSWGFSIGFYLSIISLILVFSPIELKIVNKLKGVLTKKS